MRAIKAYDILQILRDGVWMDYSTLRDADDFFNAEKFVRGSKAFRVVSGNMPNVGEVLLSS